MALRSLKALGRIAINSAVSMLIVYAVVCWSDLKFYTWWVLPFVYVVYDLLTSTVSVKLQTVTLQSG